VVRGEAGVRRQRKTSRDTAAVAPTPKAIITNGGNPPPGGGGGGGGGTAMSANTVRKCDTGTSRKGGE